MQTSYRSERCVFQCRDPSSASDVIFELVRLLLKGEQALLDRRALSNRARARRAARSTGARAPRAPCGCLQRALHLSQALLECRVLLAELAGRLVERLPELGGGSARGRPVRLGEVAALRLDELLELVDARRSCASTCSRSSSLAVGEAEAGAGPFFWRERLRLGGGDGAGGGLRLRAAQAADVLTASGELLFEGGHSLEGDTQSLADLRIREAHSPVSSDRSPFANQCVCAQCTRVLVPSRRVLCGARTAT